MDFEDYKAKLFAFRMVFPILSIVPFMKDEISRNGKDVFVSDLRNWMDKITKRNYINMPTIPLPIKILKSIKSVNLAADKETLTRQAEAVKNEIIAYRKLFNIMMDKTLIKRVPRIAFITDFIRDPAGKIVYPFGYWHDCIEVYLRKYLYDHTNGQIVRDFRFTTTSASPGRQRQQVVADMLAETERLIDAALRDRFPPSILRGTRKPTMINEEK